jgi:2'-5' RNA ligase
VAAEVAALVPPDVPQLRRVGADLLHFTLAFLGSLPDERVSDVTEALSDAARGAPPFYVRIDEVGRFPANGGPRVVWVGPRDPATASAIVELGAAVRAGLVRREIPFDAKALRPHVTLARVRDGASREEERAIAAAVAAIRVEEPPAFRADAVHVVESTLGAKGPRYASRAKIALGASLG